VDPARTVVLEITHENARGNIELTVGEWQDSQIEIAFRDRLYRNSGVIQFDGKTGRSLIKTIHPYTGPLENPEAFNGFFAPVIREFANACRFGWSPAPQQMVTYDAGYHQSKNYIQGDPLEIQIKTVQAQILSELANPKKCIIAGCSNGELVRQCRMLGIDAWGFDVIPNIQEIAFPEVRQYLRHGSVTSIPYAADDNFDTLVAVDVLEHIPERDLPMMVEQWLRLGVRQLVLLINLNQFWYPGHITLRPLWWWAEQWKEHFQHTSTVSRFPHLPTVYSNAGLYNQQWTLWTKEQL
jgi:Methyltransferase domain